MPATSHQSDRQSMLHNEQIGRTQTEHEQRVAVEPIAEPAPTRQGEILAHCQRGDVADAAALEIARACVMDCMASTPGIVGRQRQRADHAPNPVVHNATAEESAVATVMLDHEKTNEEARGRHSYDEAQPIAEAKSSPHADPEHDKRSARDHNLQHAASMIRFTVVGENLSPVARSDGPGRSLCPFQRSDPLLACPYR